MCGEGDKGRKRRAEDEAGTGDTLERHLGRNLKIVKGLEEYCRLGG